MPITTYLDASDFKRTIKNAAVVEALADLQKRHPQDGWQVIEYEHKTTKRWFWSKSKTVYFYSLFKWIMAGEYQIINFYRENSGSNVNTMVPAELIIAFMYGAMK